jgi:hypothetical protein
MFMLEFAIWVFHFILLSLTRIPFRFVLSLIRLFISVCVFRVSVLLTGSYSTFTSTLSFKASLAPQLSYPLSALSTLESWLL